MFLKRSDSSLPNANINLVSGLSLTTPYASLTGFSAAILISTLGSNNSLYTFQTSILSSALIPPRVFGDINTTT